MFRSDDVILVTRKGRPAGFFLPWQTPDLPDDVRREVFLRLTEQIAAQRKEASGVTVYTTGELLDAMRDAGGEAG